MATRAARNKRPKISELPKYKPQPMRQLKLTAFFKKQPDCVTNHHHVAAIKDVPYCDTTAISEADKPKLNSSILDTSATTTMCDDDDDDDSDIEVVYCSENIAETSMISNASKSSLADNKSRRKYTDSDFVEFDNFNYNDETITDKTNSKERRRCPFYKRIPYTEICVDAFNFAKETNLKHYFLTHFHADHYTGMTKGFNKPIYCSPITGRLLRHKFKVSPKYIHCHELDKPFYVNKVRCTFYEANHCPGAVIIIFETPSGHRYLHTGDFRACPEMENIYDLNCAPIDCCFLDTTFCDTTKTFPCQDEVLENAVSVCRYALDKNPRTLIVCGSYCIGKEKVFMAVAEALDLKIWCNAYKRGYFKCLEDKALNARLTDKQDEAKIHVLPLKSLWKRGMREYLDKHYDHFEAIVALRPSGWEYKRNKHMVPEVEGNIAIYPVPYSEHSSYTDLERFITWLRPRRIIPTVNMGDPIKRGQMNLIFKRWQATPRSSLAQTTTTNNMLQNGGDNQLKDDCPMIEDPHLAVCEEQKHDTKQESNGQSNGHGSATSTINKKEEIDWHQDVSKYLKIELNEDSNTIEFSIVREPDQ